MTTVIEDENLQIDKLSLGPYGTNCYILSCRQTGESVLVDTPAEGDKILEHLKGLDPKYIIITHNHMDHLGAFSELKANLGVPVAVHPKDAGKLPSRPEVLLQDGDILSFGKVALKVLHADLAEDLYFIERFKGEAENLARLQHLGLARSWVGGAEQGLRQQEQ